MEKAEEDGKKIFVGDHDKRMKKPLMNVPRDK